MMFQLPLFRLWMMLSIPLSFLAIFNLPKDFIIYRIKNIFSEDILKLSLIALIFLSAINAALFLDLTIIPSFLLISLLTAYFYKQNLFLS